MSRRTPLNIIAKRVSLDAQIGLRSFVVPTVRSWLRRNNLLRLVATNFGRSLILMVAFAATLAFWEWLSRPLIASLTSTSLSRLELIELSKTASYPLLILSGLPILFLLWAFRDSNERLKIENNRKDVNLKEFQELQSRAAGLFSSEYPRTAIESLQTASIYQLAGFLKGDYGASFQRPTLETLRVLANQYAVADGSKRVMDKIEFAARWYQNTTRTRTTPISSYKISNFLMKVGRLHDDRSPESVISHPVKVLSTTSQYFVHKLAFSRMRLFRFMVSRVVAPRFVFDRARLTKGQFSWCKFDRSIVQISYFNYTTFVKSRADYAIWFSTCFVDCRFQEMKIRRSELHGCLFIRCHFTKSDLRFTDLEQCDFRMTTFDNVDLRGSKLNWAKVREATFRNVDLRGAELGGIDPNLISNASGTKIDKTTRLGMRIDQTDGSFVFVESDEAKRMWLEKGAIFVEG